MLLLIIYQVKTKGMPRDNNKHFISFLPFRDLLSKDNKAIHLYSKMIR